MKDLIGNIHSYENLGTFDGPGVRFVVFMQGCLLRCKYCHNPDTWAKTAGTPTSVSDLVKRILPYKPFIQDGGVTFSGGEPLLQADFIEQAAGLLMKEGIYTCIDTSGAVPVDRTKNAIDAASMIILDLKDIDSDDCKTLTGMGNENPIETLKYCQSTSKPVWIRHVLIPKITLIDDKIERIAVFIKDFSCIKRVELLPYHKMGDYKWKELGGSLPLSEYREPTALEVKMAKFIFAEKGINVK